MLGYRQRCSFSSKTEKLASMRSPKPLAVLRIHTFSTQTVKKGIIIKKNNLPPECMQVFCPLVALCLR